MTSYSEPLDPITKTRIKMRLYQNVENTPELRKKILGGELRCCIVKPELVYDPLQVTVAANKALTNKKQTTKSVFTEILFNLSPSTNISQSLLKFGINDQDKNLLVVTLEKEGEARLSEEVFSAIQGSPLDILHLGCLSDVGAIRKLYKITDKEHESVNLIDSVVSRIALKE
ncbi:EKC/KEOPS complex subunit TPRKB-like [Anthonomus grandis grandis]|uniref:EKC/KEOPS complex subunit TPRKB-like n=1 Tax=Anthonomus grandis grandis TaxID=2921223 RepID=UPI0021667BEE|nr:EKC/KEOPS complex subunit TPRKB-like [Anthonomus grandis grandis]